MSELFSISIDTFYSNLTKTMVREIDEWTRVYLLDSDQEQLVENLLEKYALTIPTLNIDGIVMEYEEETRTSRVGANLPGTRYTFEIPFTGDARAFNVHPSHWKPIYYDGGKKQIKISNNKITISYWRIYPGTANREHHEVQRDFEDDRNNIKTNLDSLANQIRTYNHNLKSRAKSQIEARIKKFKSDYDVAKSLGYPLKQRRNSLQTHKPPSIRRKATPPQPKHSATPDEYLPLEDKHYEHILTVIKNMVTVMEYSPKAFASLGEEDLRFHFLVQLNGHYEGNATGETFNYGGKTDILIKMNGRNIFIAECKFWKGRKKLVETVDQILGYTSWRDTKTAIIIFNQNKNFSEVISQIPEVIREHKNYVNEVEYPSESGFRFVLHHIDDVNRRLTLTVLVFNVKKDQS